MKPDHPAPAQPRRWFRTGLAACVAALIAACRSAPPAPPSVPEDGPTPTTTPGTTGPRSGTPGSARPSAATTPRAYRQDAATHLYGLNAARIYKGRMPPLLYAIGVLQVDIDAGGRVLRTSWLRAPRHAPEVMAEIERTVRAAGPFPSPARLGKVAYTDTWLWDKSGHFQLDTLTEGQD